MLNDFINSYDFISVLESFTDLLFVIGLVLFLHLSINLIFRVHKYITNCNNVNSNGDNNEKK